MATTLADISIKDSSSWNTYLNLIYPVGSVYFSYSSTSPATRFGGTWSAISGRFIYTGGTGTGGSSSVSHNHGAGAMYAKMIPNQNGTITTRYAVTTAGETVSWTSTYYCDYSRSGFGSSSATNKEGVALGGNTSHSSINIYPLYQQLYCWRRTA